MTRLLKNEIFMVFRFWRPEPSWQPSLSCAITARYRSWLHGFEILKITSGVNYVGIGYTGWYPAIIGPWIREKLESPLTGSRHPVLGMKKLKAWRWARIWVPSIMIWVNGWMLLDVFRYKTLALSSLLLLFTIMLSTFHITYLRYDYSGASRK